MNTFTKWAAAVITVVVATGWIYGLTSKDSELVQSFKNAGLVWNIAGIAWFFAGAFCVYKVASGKWGTGKDNRDLWLNIVLVAATVLGAIFISAGFSFGA